MHKPSMNNGSCTINLSKGHMKKLLPMLIRINVLRVDHMCNFLFLFKDFYKIHYGEPSYWKQIFDDFNSIVEVSKTKYLTVHTILFRIESITVRQGICKFIQYGLALS